MKQRTLFLNAYADFFEKYDIQLTVHQLLQLRCFVDELSQWNRAINLTGLRSQDEIITHLVLDSLICGTVLPRSGNLVDVGSGAGFPAIPIKIYSPQLKVALIEPKRKKANFLRHATRLLHLSSVVVYRETFQAHITKNKANYDIVTTRGLLEPKRALLMLSPLLKHKGMIALFLGEGAYTSLCILEGIAIDAGLKLHQLLTYTLPGLKAKRCICTFEKCKMQDTTS